MCPLLFLFSCDTGEKMVYIAVPFMPTTQTAVRIACDEVNARGGIRGRKVELLSFRADNPREGAREAGTNIAMKIIDDGRASFVIGHSDSSSSLAASHIYDRENIITFVPTGTTPLLNQIGKHVFCMSMNNNHQGKALVEFIKGNLKENKVVLLYQSNEYSKTISRSFQQEAKRTGVELADTFWLPGVIEEDQKRVICSAIDIAEKTGTVNLVALGNNSLVFAILRELQARKKMSVKNLICGDSTEFYTIAEENIDLLKGLNVYSLSNLDTYSKDQKVLDFRRKYKNITGKEAGSLSHLSYDAAWFIFDLLEEAGWDKEKQLQLIPQKRFEGITGRLRFLANGESRRALYITNWVKGDNIKVIDLYDAS